MGATRVAAWCIAAGLFGWERPALAQQDAAEALFREGRAAMQRGDIDTACAKFRESVARFESAGAMLNLAECEAKRDHVLDARELWQHGRDRLPPGDERRSIVEQRLRDMAARVARLRIHLEPGAPSGTSITVDAHPARDGVIEVDPGSHQIEASAVGCSPARVTATLRPGAAEDVNLAPTACAGAATADTTSSASHGSSGWRTLGWISGGVGVAALGVAAVTGFMALDRQSKVDDACQARLDGERQCTPAGIDAGRDGATLVTINTIAFVTAGVGLAAAGVLLWTSRDKGRASLRARPSAGGGALVLDGRL